MGEGLKIEAVSYMLGHKNVETTLFLLRIPGPSAVD